MGLEMPDPQQIHAGDENQSWDTIQAKDGTPSDDAISEVSDSVNIDEDISTFSDGNTVDSDSTSSGGEHHHT